MQIALFQYSFYLSSPELLSQSGVQFTDRSLALNQVVPRYSTPDEFSKLPFKDIYQEGPLIGMSDSQKKAITGHKQAEVIVPESLGLDYLKVILVRSVAERETLLNLLHDDDVYQYDDLIQVQKEDYFFMDRNFIEDVELITDRLRVRSNVNEAYPKEWGLPTEDRGIGFALNEEATDNYLNVTMKVLVPDGTDYWWPNKNVRALLLDKIELTLPVPLQSYQLIVDIDGHIAYKGSYEQNFEDIDMPF
ncbi:DarT ssDNA thymidine ADP-ribosyltransferase family protein [Levilactobacillus fuyuanensis]|uniref:DarT ssDNA thymidine ADP-ribosyltransferase family protein n=1 Tax=Levilactobacillus fuyuanensis TaxID=2486022 RepID=A0ABW4H2V0_9LACO|nr:DarT ssDNA thymidine ADP-ribosyltransferase family protein [Levilactobacillus fuyuanensis]